MSEEPSPGEAMTRAVADLWSQLIATGDDDVVFFDHDGNPARIRHENGSYYIAWTAEEGSVWQELPRAFDNPRQAALHAFQGPIRGS